MSESKPQWTPGPWEPWGLHRSPRITTSYTLPERQNCCKAIADTCLWDGMPDAEKEANAHLIASAPDIYEALRPLAAVRLDHDTVSAIADTIIVTTGDGELALYIANLLTDGAEDARRVSAKARGEEAPE